MGSACSSPGDSGSGPIDYGPDEARLAGEIVHDLDSFWAEADAELGYEYRRLTGEQLTVGDEGVTCDGVEIRRSDVIGNAFVADCAEGIVVAYDPDYVNASEARAEATMAHEWGHVLQIQAGGVVDISRDPGGLPIDAELQADCFAGAWAAARGDAGLAALLADVEASGDPADVAIHDPEAHGTADERRSAFELGLDQGPRACVEALAELLAG